IGDPGVELWTGIPQDLVANYETEISPGTNYLEVTITDNNEVPLEGAWVTTLMGDDEIFVTGYTDENGYVALEINANTIGAANLTVTKHNYIPHLGGFDVGEVDRFVNVFDVIIDDDNTGTSIGNNDGMINPGEAIELNVSLKNFGSQTANSVTAIISTDNDFVTITDDSEDFGSIAPGSSVYCSDDFDISIAEDVLGGTEIRLDIVIEDNIGNIWNDIIFLIVEGANLDAEDYTIEDANGYLDPGETVEMNVTLQNNGLVAADAVYGELISPDNRVTVSDADGYFGTIAGEGGQGSNTSDTFEVIAGSQLIVGTQIMMELHLYNADGYDSTVHFLLGIGEVSITDPVGPDAYGYFCYDDGDIDYLSVPTYNWVEINSIGTNLNLYDPGDTGDIETFNLPITFRMYGEEYDTATVCSNGWIAPGGSTQASFMNSPIPGPQGPSPMIAPFWDDLKTASGAAYWYYDSSLHTVIIEWDHFQNDEDSYEETFQVILYDANYYPTTTGDSEIKFQYKVINNTSAGSYPSQHGQYSTVGIEDHTGTVGLEYTFNNSYPEAAKHLQNEMALLITGPSIPLAEPFLVLGGVTIIDENGNGQADYGEDVSLDILLNNLGENPATNVSATISSADVYITINQAVSAYSNIQGGGSASSQTDFEITVAENCPDGHLVNIEMNITSNEDTWVLYFTLELNAPVVEFHSIFVDDGENNILDPGETADIYVSFSNSGGADATNVLTELSESDPYITLNTTTHTFALLNAGSVSTAMFNVTASASAPIGHLAAITWEMNGDINFNVSGSFDLVISQVPVLLEEDFSGTYPPNGWTLTGLNPGNWSQSFTNNAGGSSPESELTWSPSFVGESRLVSPVLNTSGSATLDFEFQHYLNDYNGQDYVLSVRTTSNGGSTWNTAWEIDPNGNVGPELIDLSVSTPDVGSQNFQIAFVFDGNSYNINYWYFDNIHLEGGQGTAMGFVEGNVALDGGTGNVENVVITAGNFATSPNISGDYILPLPAGTYDIIASLDGYETVTEYDVQVIPNETETINFVLTYLQAPEN
ncbi:MAG: choice-of-anchor J domain-containing protein, partial [Candidatus Cloacimonadota bacterium]|nr:choice-of-anchor J domain-containing protein [Candidatus Cloacimonadota bacterium]